MNRIVLADFHNTRNQDMPTLPSCIVSKFTSCTPQDTIGLVVPSRNVIDVTRHTNFPRKVLAALVVDFNNVWIWADNGKVYLMNYDLKTYTEKHTMAPASGSTNVYNVVYNRGKIYYAMENWLGELDPVTETFNDAFGEFKNGGTTIDHPMAILRKGEVAIGDGPTLAYVDLNGTFVDSVLETRPDFSITALFPVGEDLMIGASPRVNNDTSLKDYSVVYRWDGWSEDYDTPTAVYCNRVFGFMYEGGNLYILGKQNFLCLFLYDPLDCPMYMEVDNTFPHQEIEYNTSFVYPMAIQRINRRWMFGVGDKIYTFYAGRAGINPTLHLEYNFNASITQPPAIYGIHLIPSTTQGRDIAVFFNLFLYDAGSNNTYIRQLGTGRASFCSIETGVIEMSRLDQRNFQVEVATDYVPGNLNANTATMTLEVYANGIQSSGIGPTQTLTLRLDTTRNVWVSTEDIIMANYMRFILTWPGGAAGIGLSLRSISLLTPQ